MSPDGSVVSVVGAVLTLVMGVLLLILPRRFAILPIAFITCYMTFGQDLVVAGLHFTMLRVLVLFGCARVVLWMEFRAFKWQRIDTLVALWVTSDVVVYTLRLHSGGALVNRLGFAYNAFGLYFIFRILVQNIDDIKRTCRLFAVMVVPLAICMVIERTTGRNLFYAFGGVPQFTGIREGALRCQGPFSHPILAGTFGAIWLPLFIGLWWQGKGNRFLAVLGILSATTITFLASSTGPLGTYLAGLVGIGMWQMRNHMRPVRWAIAGVLIVLDIMMSGQIWYIFGYLSGVGFEGSQGWHRTIVIDAMVKHFSQWWLLGTTVANIAQWGVHAGDITNQYAGEAQEGGLLTLILFVSIIVFAFSQFGLAMRTLRSESKQSHRLLWSVSVMLFAHVVTFFGVTYFDQNIVNWYLVLAMAATAGTVYRYRTELVPQLASTSKGMRSPIDALKEA
jgi:hypothetical protein